MPIQDRSNEFRSCVQSIRTRSVGPPAKQKPLKKRDGDGAEKSNFSIASAGIRKAISETALKLNKLGQREFLSNFSSSLSPIHLPIVEKNMLRI